MSLLVLSKRKHVINEARWADFQLPERNHYVVKVLKTVGNNLHMVITPSGDEFKASMPPKFRKVIWVKRGDYLLVEPIAEGKKVKAEIVKILNKDSINFYKENNVWPEEFDDSKYASAKNKEDDMFQLFENINVNCMQYSNQSSSSSSDSGICDEDY